MKTIYSKPNIEIVVIEVPQLMNVSGSEGTVNSVSVATEDYSGGEVLGRGGSFWDDEDY